MRRRKSSLIEALADFALVMVRRAMFASSPRHSLEPRRIARAGLAGNDRDRHVAEVLTACADAMTYRVRVKFPAGWSRARSPCASTFVIVLLAATIIAQSRKGNA